MRSAFADSLLVWCMIGRVVLQGLASHATPGTSNEWGAEVMRMEPVGQLLILYLCQSCSNQEELLMDVL